MCMEETWKGVKEGLANHEKILEMCQAMKIPAVHFGLTDALKENDGTTSSSIVGTLEEVQKMFAVFAQKQPQVAAMVMIGILAGLHCVESEEVPSMPN